MNADLLLDVAYLLLGLAFLGALGIIGEYGWEAFKDARWYFAQRRINAQHEADRQAREARRHALATLSGYGEDLVPRRNNGKWR